MTTRITPRTVNFLSDADDIQLLRAIGLGYTNRLISNRTSLTPSQINYRAMRLRQLGVTRAAYRNGEGIVAKIVEQTARKQIDAALIRHLRAQL